MSSPTPTGQAIIALAGKQKPINIQGLPVALVSLAVTLAIATTICVAFRVCVRAWILRAERPWGWDDTFAVLSLLTFIPQCVFAIIAARYGLGTHDADLNELVKAQAALMMGNWQMCYAASTVLVKSGIAITLLRLADQRKYRWPIITALTTTPIFTLVIVVLLIVTCRPVGAQFDSSLGPCPMHNWLAILSYPFTALTVLLDWSCAIIPWLLIRKLQLNRRIKSSLIVVLSLGAIASIGAIARLPYLKYYTIDEDQLYHTANIVFWSVFENGIGIIAASLPPIHKLFKYYDDSSAASGKNYGAGAVQTIGGTPLSHRHGTFELSPMASRAPVTMVSAGRRSTWDRLQDDDSGGDGVIVYKTFFVLEESEAEAGRREIRDPPQMT